PGEGTSAGGAVRRAASEMSREQEERTVNPKELGRRGEEEAARFLERKGWTILARNARVGRWEVDLIATRSDVLAFVEVKSRRGTAFGAPLAAISVRKMQHIARAAAGWIRDQGHSGAKEIRFDAVGVLWPRDAPPCILHLPDAWRMG
ncbi:MAG: YraN family protein, partial [Longimicrobiales bacterium]